VIFEWAPRAVIALDEHFLGKTFQGGAFAVDEASRLDGAGGGKGPARSALSLVLHGSDGSLAHPVDRVAARDGRLDVVLLDVSVFNETSTISSLDEHGELIL